MSPDDADVEKDRESRQRDADEMSLVVAKKKAASVGVALLITAIFAVVSNVIGVIALSNFLQKQNPTQPPPNMSAEEKKQWERGKAAAPAGNLCFAVFVSLVYLPVFLGGLKLQQGQGRGLGKTAAIMAMLPCSAAFLIGLPIGIWALRELNNEVVQEALDTPPEPRRRRPRPPREPGERERTNRPRQLPKGTQDEPLDLD